MARNNPSGLIFRAGLIAGAAIGAVVGLLLAPEKGEDTRIKVKGQIAKLKSNSGVYKAEINRFKDENLPKVQEHVKKTAALVQDKVEDWSKVAKAKAQDAKQLIEVRLAAKELKQQSE